MKKTSTPTISQRQRQAQQSRVVSPRLSTIEMLRQFARAYMPVDVNCPELSAVVLN